MRMVVVGGGGDQERPEFTGMGKGGLDSLPLSYPLPLLRETKQIENIKWLTELGNLSLSVEKNISQVGAANN